MKTIVKISILLITLIISAALINKVQGAADNKLPLIAIANYGPHSSLEESIRGIKEGLAKEGFESEKNIRFEISDVSFDTSLIMQMIAKFKAINPKIMVAQTTPVAQAAKNMIKDIPIVFADITDPHEAGLDVGANITGVSDKQDLTSMLKFVQMLLPNAKRIGMFYATSESNDVALLRMMQEAASTQDMSVVAVPIEQARDLAARIQAFKGKVDVIYVGSSGPIQPSLPTIVAFAEEMKIPVLNMNSEEVKDGKVFASFGVSYFQIGVNAAKIIAKILNGEQPSAIASIYPTSADHEAFISKKRAAKIGFIIPDNIPNLHVVE